MAEQHNLQPSRRDTDREIDKEGSLVRMRTSMSLKGNYEDIRRFIYQVESGTDFIVIDSVVLRQGTEPGFAADVGSRPVHVLPREARWRLNGSAKLRSRSWPSCSSQPSSGGCGRLRHPLPPASRADERRPRRKPAASAASEISARSESRRAQGGTPGAGRQRQKSFQVQAEAAAASAANAEIGEHDAAAPDETGPVEPPPPPPIPLKYIGLVNHDDPKVGRDGSSQRLARRLLRTRRRDHRRAISNSEDRRRINRPRISRRARSSDHQTNRTIKRRMRRLTRVSALLLALALLTGCAAGRAFRRGEDRARVGDWDSAVTYYRQAMQADPDKAEYRIALERAMLNASRVHFDTARQLEAKDQLDAALLEYRRTVEYDPGNRQAVDKIVQLEKTIRDRHRGVASEAGDRPAARTGAAGRRRPALEPGVACADRLQLQAVQPARHSHVHQQRDRHQRHLRCELPGSTRHDSATGLGRAGAQLAVVVSTGSFTPFSTSGRSSSRRIRAPNRLKYERQVAITLPISYADATEVAQMLTAITRTTTGVTIPPVIIPNKTANTDHGARHAAGDRRHPGAGDVERQAPCRGDARCRDPRSEPHAHEGAGPESDAAPDRRHFLARAGAARIAGSGSQRRHHRCQALQPQHDHAGRQHGRFLSDGSAGHRPVSRDRCEHPCFSRRPSFVAPKGRS